MKEILIKALHEALGNYTHKADRGYKPGLFNKWRHSFLKSEKIANLENKLIACNNDDDALSVIIEHLLNPETTFHHHSFNNYLIDELKKLVKQIEWDCFTPIAIKQYQGPLYRGTSQPPEKIFEQGFNELTSSLSIEEYLKFKNDSIGVSTSKDFDCAMDYATNNKRSNKQRYIYAINYRDENGYDVLETGKARGLSFHPILHSNHFSGWAKREVNIKQSIQAFDIIGAWKLLPDGELFWIDNPNYQLERKELKNFAF